MTLEAQSMNRIKNFTIEGFKSIRSMELELKQLNVLIGANGSGKSNLIGFFRLLNFLESGALQLHIGEQGGANSILYYGAKNTPQLSCTINFETNNGNNRYHLRLIHVAGDTLIFADEEIQYSQKGKITEGPRIPLGAGHKESGMIAKSEDKITSQAKTSKVIRTMMRDWQVFQFHDTSSTAHIKQSKYIDDSYFLKANAGNLAPFLYQMKRYKRDYYQRIIETIKLGAPFFDDFVLIPRENNIMLNWKEKNSDILFGPHQLSDGTLRMMAIVTLLLQPKLPSMVIIDEPELGLHPYAITVLAGLLKSASARSQLLISTQSTNLIDELDPQDIIVVDRKDGQSIFRRQDPTALDAWLDEYTMSELWEKNVLGGRPA
jgi:predicted ATPase